MWWKLQRDYATQQPYIEDSIIANAPKVIRGKIIKDNVIGQWTIKVSKDSNEAVVGRVDRPVRDSSVFINQLYGYENEASIGVNVLQVPIYCSDLGWRHKTKTSENR